ncbi:MAG: transcription termination factor NusA [Calditrichia bacterium]
MNIQILEAVSQIARDKRISKDDLRDILEEIFANMLKKKYENIDNFDIIVNIDKGDVEIYQEKEVVEEVNDPQYEISLEDARKLDEDAEIGDEIVEIVKFEDFGWRLINYAKQALMQKIREFEKYKIYDEYKNREGEIIWAEVHLIGQDGVYLLADGTTELYMPNREKIPSDKFRVKDKIRVLIKEVKEPDSPSVMSMRRKRRRYQGPDIIVSRADELFLKRLFEIEVPEIYDGIVEIKAIARKPGLRAKVAVESMDARIDAVGACVGMKGVRIQNIVKELAGEKIDVINYSIEPEVFVARSLTPIKPIKVILTKSEKVAAVIVADKDMPNVVGKGVYNIELAQQLTGYAIEAIKETEYLATQEEDVTPLEEVEDLPANIIEKLKEHGVDTLEELRSMGLQGLMEIPGIGQKTAQKIISTIGV